MCVCMYLFLPKGLYFKIIFEFTFIEKLFSD